MARESESTYRFRRQSLIALILTFLYVFGDMVAKNGSDLPVLQIITTSLMLSTGPIVLNRVIDMFNGEDNA
jgi:hypothetical protein